MYGISSCLELVGTHGPGVLYSTRIELPSTPRCKLSDNISHSMLSPCAALGVLPFSYSSYNCRRRAASDRYLAEQILHDNSEQCLCKIDSLHYRLYLGQIQQASSPLPCKLVLGQTRWPIAQRSGRGLTSCEKWRSCLSGHRLAASSRDSLWPKWQSGFVHCIIDLETPFLARVLAMLK